MYQHEKQLTYSLKKLSIGLVSVAVGMSIGVASQTVLADEVVDSTPSVLDRREDSNRDKIVGNTDNADLEATVSDVTSSDSATPASLAPSANAESPSNVAAEESTSIAENTENIAEPSHSIPEADIKPSTSEVAAEHKLDEVPSSEITNGAKDSSLSTVSISAKRSLEVTPPKVEQGYFRLHLKELPSADVDNLGLWLWGDVDQPSTNWPSGAISFKDAKKDSYGYYLDFKLSEKQKKQISYLVNSRSGAGENLSNDRQVDLLTPDMNEAWVDKQYKSYAYPPLEKGKVRINYANAEGNYANLSVWLFGDVKTPSTNWPQGSDMIQKGAYGAYLDVPLKENAKELGFLILDKSKPEDSMKIQPKDYKFLDLENHSQVFVHDKDPKVYNNPYYVDQIQLKGAEQVEENSINATFSTLEGISKEELQQNLKVTDKNGNTIAITAVQIKKDSPILTLSGDFNQSLGALTVSYGGENYPVRLSWELKDKRFAYDGELGTQLSADGKTVDMKLWSPSADAVKVIVYDKKDQTKQLGSLDLVKGDRGVWSLQLNSQSGLGITDYTGYYYHYEIKRGNETVLVLDPYAKSLAEWNSAMVGDRIKTAKAAFVNPSKLGPKELDFAHIEGFKGREDAIIYEAHVRDFTSDSRLESSFKKPFGTFSAFIEKLDYLKELGVTHVQLLPVMSYFYVNEADKSRSTAYSSQDNNYNWGYDPQSYFALSGMYSENAKDPEKRIIEFKNLVNEIHKRGMGVVMDVVYNHTARTYLFEDIEPNYYHFMNTDGTARESFGGGRLGTSHAMSRRVLVDSIKYLVKEFKVDGFRFDMMGDHDAAAIEEAFKAAKAINPNIIMTGEGWITYQGDEAKPLQPADQTWMASTDTVGVFSDDIRNKLKSGYPSEGEPAFITGGAQKIETIFKNIKAQPTNFVADSPGDVVQYIAAHDNLTLHDVIAKSINKDPKTAAEEIHQRIRLGNTIILTSQGTAFLHSGQEYGRTKQYLAPAYSHKVADGHEPYKSTLIEAVTTYPYFIHDSYDSSDAVNHFDWEKATNATDYPINVQTQRYTAGLIALRRSTDAFRKKSMTDVERDVTLITSPANPEFKDLLIGYQTVASNGDVYAVFINADSKDRQVPLTGPYARLLQANVIVDKAQAGITTIVNPKGIQFLDNGIKIDALTAIVLKLPVKADTSTMSQSSQSQETKERQPLPTIATPKRGSAEETTLTNLTSPQKGADLSVKENQSTKTKLETLAKPTTTATATQTRLPETGSARSDGLMALGASLLLGLFSYLGLGRKNKG